MTGLARRSFVVAVAPVAALCALIPTSSYAQNAVTYEYDAVGRLVAVDRDLNGCDDDTLVEYQYDKSGNRFHENRLSTGCVNDPPFAFSDEVFVAYSGSTTISPLQNDSDPNGDPLTIQSFTQCSEGCSVARVSPTQLRVMGTRGGARSRFRYTVSDGRGGTATADVTVEVSGGWGGPGGPGVPN